MLPVYIIAELGINHNGNVSICKELIRSAKQCGVDSVKLQLLSPKLISADPYLIKVQEASIFNYSEWIQIIDYAQNIGIELFSSIGDVESFKLFKKLKLKRVKLSSSNLNNYPLHELVAKLRLPVILSTGDGTWTEIEKVVEYYNSLNIDISIMHCISNYPTKSRDTYLNVIPYLSRKLKVPVGFSDHTEGVLASVVAVALGAVIIEKHLTLDKNMKGPDHKSSLNVNEFKLLVNEIRETEKMKGDTNKLLQKRKGSSKIQSKIRRSIVLKEKKEAGYIIMKKDILVARPVCHVDNEICPHDYKMIIGKCLSKTIKAFEPICHNHF